MNDSGNAPTDIGDGVTSPILSEAEEERLALRRADAESQLSLDPQYLKGGELPPKTKPNEVGQVDSATSGKDRSKEIDDANRSIARGYTL